MKKHAIKVVRQVNDQYFSLYAGGELSKEYSKDFWTEAPNPQLPLMLFVDLDEAKSHAAVSRHPIFLCEYEPSETKTVFDYDNSENHDVTLEEVVNYQNGIVLGYDGVYREYDDLFNSIKRRWQIKEDQEVVFASKLRLIRQLTQKEIQSYSPEIFKKLLETMDKEHENV